jgi:hypothetical protein
MDTQFSHPSEPRDESEMECDEDLDSTEAQQEHSTGIRPPVGASPHQRQTRSFLAYIKNLEAPEVCQRIVDVLEYMESRQLNLPVLLWALSWNDAYPNIIKNNKARFARTALTTSELLPGLLKTWHHPPRKHTRGIRTEGAHKPMEDWALDAICEVLDRESDDLEESQKFLQEELSQDALLAIKWDDLISDVKILAPVTWKIFRHAASTKQQKKKKHAQNPRTSEWYATWGFVQCSFPLTRLSLQ